MQRPHGSQVERQSIGDERDIAAERSDPQGDHLPHAERRQHQPCRKIADQVPQARQLPFAVRMMESAAPSLERSLTPSPNFIQR